MKLLSLEIPSKKLKMTEFEGWEVNISSSGEFKLTIWVSKLHYEWYLKYFKDKLSDIHNDSLIVKIDDNEKELLVNEIKPWYCERGYSSLPEYTNEKELFKNNPRITWFANQSDSKWHLPEFFSWEETPDDIIGCAYVEMTPQERYEDRKNRKYRKNKLE